MLWGQPACFLLSRFKKGKHLKWQEDGEGEVFIPDDDSLRDLLDQSSGSGSGLPLLVSCLPLYLLVILPHSMMSIRKRVTLFSL